MTAAGNGDRVEDYFWATLAARVLHPVQVEIIEAMHWIDQPLSAADLAEVVNPRFKRSHLDRPACMHVELGFSGREPL
jgi:hypothetical protein